MKVHWGYFVHEKETTKDRKEEKMQRNPGSTTSIIIYLPLQVVHFSTCIPRIVTVIILIRKRSYDVYHELRTCHNRGASPALQRMLCGPVVRRSGIANSQLRKVHIMYSLYIILPSQASRWLCSQEIRRPPPRPMLACTGNWSRAHFDGSRLRLDLLRSSSVGLIMGVTQIMICSALSSVYSE